MQDRSRGHSDGFQQRGCFDFASGSSMPDDDDGAVERGTDNNCDHTDDGSGNT